MFIFLQNLTNVKLNNYAIFTTFCIKIEKLKMKKIIKIPRGGQYGPAVS